MEALKWIASVLLKICQNADHLQNGLMGFLLYFVAKTIAQKTYKGYLN